MKDIKEIKTVISSLILENKILKNVVSEKDRIINELMDKVDELENELDYKKNGIKKRGLLIWNIKYMSQI